MGKDFQKIVRVFCQIAYQEEEFGESQFRFVYDDSQTELVVRMVLEAQRCAVTGEFPAQYGKDCAYFTEEGK